MATVLGIPVTMPFILKHAPVFSQRRSILFCPSFPSVVAGLVSRPIRPIIDFLLQKKVLELIQALSWSRHGKRQVIP